MKRTAVVLLNLGGPDSLEAIEPFLFHLFSDPDIFSIPIGQRFIARMIARKRAPKVRKNYEAIGGSSPVNMWTEKQRLLLQDSLRQTGGNYDVYTAMRYWKPFTEEAASAIEQKEYDSILLLPLYPHFSKVTSGSSFKRWDKLFKGDINKVLRIEEYCVHPQYIAALNERIDKAVESLPPDARGALELVFSAHGVPEKLIAKGDPYKDQIEQTAKAVFELRNDFKEYHICYQSKVGPVKWLQPDVADTLRSFSEQGKKDVLIVPVSFVSDHVETTYELGVEYKEVADGLGFRTYEITEGLNDSPLFITALKSLVLDIVKKKEQDE